jgi:hypothetical protein
LKFDLRTVWPEMFVEQRPKVLQKSTTSTHCFGKLSRTYNNVFNSWRFCKTTFKFNAHFDKFGIDINENLANAITLRGNDVVKRLLNGNRAQARATMIHCFSSCM